MRLLSSTLPSIWMMVCVVTYASAYFIVDEPQANRQWVNNVPNLISWTKGLEDGITGFDLEMTQMGIDGLTLVARNVPVAPGKINILLQGVPPGNDYFLLFVNTTGGMMYTKSSKFTILAQSATPSSTPPSPANNVPTVTLSGGPNQSQLFATTFAALANGAVTLVTAMQGKSLILMVLGCAFGAFLTLGW